MGICFASPVQEEETCNSFVLSAAPFWLLRSSSFLRPLTPPLPFLLLPLRARAGHLQRCCHGLGLWMSVSFVSTHGRCCKVGTILLGY